MYRPPSECPSIRAPNAVPFYNDDKIFITSGINFRGTHANRIKHWRCVTCISPDTVLSSCTLVGWIQAPSRHYESYFWARERERERERDLWTYPGDVAEWPLYAVLALWSPCLTATPTRPAFQLLWPDVPRPSPSRHTAHARSRPRDRLLPVTSRIPRASWHGASTICARDCPVWRKIDLCKMAAAIRSQWKIIVEMLLSAIIITIKGKNEKKIIIIITTTMFMVLLSWPKSLREFTRFIWQM